MSKDAIKIELIQWLTTLNDPETLKYLKVVKDSTNQNSDWWHDLSDEQISGIERGLNDIDAGRIHAHEEIKLKYDL